MTDSAAILSTLNPAQQQAVTVDPGPVLVLAGPGSGKTRVLTHRVAYLIGAQGVDPHTILAVTFTNKAAREMRDRLDALIGAAQSAALTVGTFHSICARFLRRDIVHLGRERDFAIYDTDDQLRVMKRVLRDLNLEEKKHPPRAIHAAINAMPNAVASVSMCAASESSARLLLHRPPAISASMNNKVSANAIQTGRSWRISAGTWPCPCACPCVAWPCVCEPWSWWCLLMAPVAILSVPLRAQASAAQTRPGRQHRPQPAQPGDPGRYRHSQQTRPTSVQRV